MAQKSNPNAKKSSDAQESSSNRKRKKKPKFKISSVFFIFFIVYVASFFAYMVQANASNEIPTQEDSLILGHSKKNDTEVETTTTVSDDETVAVVNPVPESVSVDEEYLNTCMFVGDSISEGFANYFFLDEANVLAKKGLRPDNVLDVTVDNSAYGGEVSVMDAIVQSGFKNIYIMLGSNGVGWASNDLMVDGYRNFINEIEDKVEDANVYIVSVPPVTAKKEDTNEYPTIEDGLVYNSSIDELNELYLSLANELGVHYLDINSYLKDDTGKLPYDSSSDGMHFDSATYQKVLDYVCSHVSE